MFSSVSLFTKRGSHSPVSVLFVVEPFFCCFFRLRLILGLWSPFFHVMLLENYFLFNGVNGNVSTFVWKWWHTFVAVYTWLNNVCGRLDPFRTRSVPFFHLYCFIHCLLLCTKLWIVKWKLESGLLCCFYVSLRQINNNTLVIHSLYDFGEFSMFSRNTCMYLSVCHLSHSIERPLYELRSSFTDWVHLWCENDSKFRPFLPCLEFAFPSVLRTNWSGSGT